MCDMHDGVQPWRRGALPAVHAHVPHRVHQQLADAFVCVSVVPRAGGRRPAHQLRNQLIECRFGRTWTIQSSLVSVVTS